MSVGGLAFTMDGYVQALGKKESKGIHVELDFIFSFSFFKRMLSTKIRKL